MIKATFRMKSIVLVFGVGATVAAGCSSTGQSDEPRTGEVRARLSKEALFHPAPEPDYLMGLEDVDGTGAKAVPAQRLTISSRSMTDEEIASLPKEKRDGLFLPPKGPPPLRDDSAYLAELEKMDPGTMVPIVMSFEDPPFAWHELRRRAQKDEDRAAVIDARREQTGALTRDHAEALRRMGALDVAEAWLVPVVYATLPAELAKALVDLKQPNNIAVEHLIRKGAAPAYGGGEARSAMRLTNFLANGIDGSTGNHVNGASRVRIAINDSDDLKYTHLGFRRKVGGSFVSSFAAMRRCGTSSCVDYTPTSVDSHGSWMSRIIIGSLEDGQDPAVTSTTDRLQRSGVISKAAADLYYYSDSGARMPAMFGQAVLDNIDVLNMSNKYSAATDCNSTHNPNPGDNEAMYDVVEAGVLPVKAIGNEGVNSTCNAVWPGMRRDGLAIAAINTPLTSTPYDSATTSGVSSTGNMQIRTFGTSNPPPASQKYAIADLSAPCGYSWWYRDPNNPGNNSINTYDPVGVGPEGCYTSNAAPAVTAAIAYLRSAFWSIGWGGNNARDLTVNALLMGDGYSWTTGGVSTKGFDKRSGAGRIKMHFPSSADLVAPWGWAVGAVDIASGQMKSFPVMDLLPKSTSITQLKLAMTFSERNYDQSADVDTAIYNVCNGANTLVAADISYDIRSRIVLSGAQIGNKCLEHRLYGYNIPSGETRRVYVAFYYHSGSTSNH